MNAIELLRKKVITELFDLSTMQKVWRLWQPDISKYIDRKSPTSEQLTNLGDHLYEIFKSTSSGRRGQDDVSAGGTAWESLVCWYLNLVLIGSRTVVIKAKKANIPSPISDCIAVNYGNFKSNTESDLLAVTFPNVPESVGDYHDPIKDLNTHLSKVVRDNFRECELTIIQCKTNWNDNAQIPMLWNLVYLSDGFEDDATVGSNGYSHKQLKKFKYAFATVPTVKPENFKESSTSVKRVQHLKGGNFWGLPTKEGIATNIGEMKDINFQSALNDYQRGWNADIGSSITKLNFENYFNLP